MNFINPYTEIYNKSQEFQFNAIKHFYKEVIWNFLKHLDNEIGLYKHRVNINFVDSSLDTGVRRFGSIYEYGVKVDLNSFLDLTEESKREFLLKIIYTSFYELGKEFNWDLESIKSAYHKASLDNESFYFVSAEKTARNKNHSGAISFKLEGKNLIVYCEIRDNSTNSQSKNKLLETDEDNFSWSRKIKDYGWYDNYRFGLKFLTGDLWIVKNIQSGEIEEIINSKKNSQKVIEDFLKEIKTTYK